MVLQKMKRIDRVLTQILHRLIRRITASPKSTYSNSVYRTNSKDQNPTSNGQHPKHHQSHTSSTGRSAPGWKPWPATPSDARCIRQLPLHKPKLSSRNAAATNKNLLTLPAATAWAPSMPRNVHAGFPRRPYVSTEKGTHSEPVGCRCGASQHLAAAHCCSSICSSRGRSKCHTGKVQDRHIQHSYA
jgi:hypothetical protein